jgi:hypothetical protein
MWKLCCRWTPHPLTGSRLRRAGGLVFPPARESNKARMAAKGIKMASAPLRNEEAWFLTNSPPPTESRPFDATTPAGFLRATHGILASRYLTPVNFAGWVTRERMTIITPMKPLRLLVPLAVDKLLDTPKWRDPWWLGPVVFVVALVVFAIWLWVDWSPAP